ncbi:uncharacterized protein L203_105658 [Cryptococcus depauperatus CBS 7841]|uniref:Uncharacterized protein n=1 Tax=Cryptococcus depauperatus CBS 7841 TaxID=1295531 RepID=A0A1E3IF68_9TREE|nr:hypothetical protein L203_03534 [Cryptococcus depauperatus CBS 7841]ODN98607.1 hypothetical protein L204_02571 [Cryptococcus depauperatus CBS 7855]
MPRPGQKAKRRKRARISTTPPSTSFASAKAANQEDDEGNEEEGEDASGSPNPRARCLPVADLPDNFSGIPEDGGQYLAMAMKADKELPWSTRMEGWVSQWELDNAEKEEAINAKGSSERHIALPKGSWEMLFPTHFQNYRKHLAKKWPPSPLIPYPSHYPPLPDANRRSDWYMFINGYPPSAFASDKGKGKAKAKATDITEEEAMNEGLGIDPVDRSCIEIDEEAQPGPPREPLVCVLQNLNSNQAVRILSHFAQWMNESISQLPSPIPTSPELLPTQPDNDPVSPARYHLTPDRPPNPFPAHYAQWVLALLMLLDDYLSGAQVSTLRDLARAAMRVAGWRWVRGVVARNINEGWRLGTNGWKLITTSTLDAKEEEEAVDEMLARCWVVVHAIAAGWGQKDLLSDLQNLFK